jgi:hypothetical protein
MKICRLIVTATMLMGLLGCGSDQIETLVGGDTAPLNAGAPVYIAVPKDPSNDSDYAGSGMFVADSIAKRLSERHIHLSIALATATDEANLEAARKTGATYLLEPSITDWEQHETQWTGTPSRMGIRMTIIAVATGEQIRVDDIVSDSGHISFFGTDPKELLDDAIDHYVSRLYP